MDSNAAPVGWLSYRCPVCSHTDGVVLEDADSVLIRCSHCDTPLEVTGRGTGKNATTTVARPRRPTRERA